MANISELVGKTINSISGAEKDSDRIRIECSDGKTFIMWHSQDCCENVSVEDVVGDINDIIGSPILKAEETTNHDENPEGVPKKDWQESWTWTFYHIATIKGYITIRWYGESNGYYSESVEFEAE